MFFFSIGPAVVGVRSCKAECTQEEPCIRKCCPLNTLFDYERRCVPPSQKDSDWTPMVFRNPSSPKTLVHLPSINALNVTWEVKPRYIESSPRAFQSNCPKVDGDNGVLIIQPYSEKFSLVPREPFK